MCYVVYSMAYIRLSGAHTECSKIVLLWIWSTPRSHRFSPPHPLVCPGGGDPSPLLNTAVSLRPPVYDRASYASDASGHKSSIIRCDVTWPYVSSQLLFTAQIAHQSRHNNRNTTTPYRYGQQIVFPSPKPAKNLAWADGQ